MTTRPKGDLATVVLDIGLFRRIRGSETTGAAGATTGPLALEAG
jgi:hypothetical protein